MADLPNRREILKTMSSGAVGAAALVGGSGIGSAQSDTEKMIEEQEQLMKKYNEIDEVNNAVDKFSSKVLKALSARGFANSSMFGKSSINSDLIELSVTIYDKELTAFIKISQKNSDYNVDLYILPEVERSYAIVTDNGNRMAAVDPAKGIEDELSEVTTVENPNDVSNSSLCPLIYSLCAYDEPGCDYQIWLNSCEATWYRKKTYYDPCNIPAYVIDVECPAPDNTCCKNEGLSCGLDEVGCSA